MIRIKLKFVDFWPGFNSKENYFTVLLKIFYEIEFSNKPDFIIYSCFGTEFLKYNCPRIFYTAENIRPDFRFCDFAISFDYMNNSNHFRLPNYRRRFTVEDLTKLKDLNQILKQKKDFCSFVVSNSSAQERIDFFHKLSNYKKVASGGKYANNIGGRVKNKNEFIKGFLFNIAFENSSFPGYTTEKIAQAWMADSIPIYWGDPLITNDINPNCFINIHAFNSFDEAIEFIKKVDLNVELQKKYLNAPFFRNNIVPDHLQDEVIAQKLKNFTNLCLSGIPRTAAKFWHKPYYYIRKIRGGKRLVRINLNE